MKYSNTRMMGAAILSAAGSLAMVQAQESTEIGEISEIEEIVITGSRLSEDQNRLDAELTIADPFLLEEGTATVNWHFNARPAGSFDPGECSVF